MTTPPPCCSTPGRGSCGAGSPPTCPASSPAAWASPRNGSAPWCGSGIVKVAEYQARGVVHFHAVIRLDAPGEDYQPPPPGIDAAMLCDAVAPPPPPSASSSRRHRHRPHARLRRAAGTDVRIIRRDDLAGTGQALNHQAVANYIAKYATKTLTVPGLPAQRLRHRVRHRAPALPGAPPAADHHRLAARQPPLHRQARFRAWAHMLGYGGHFLTKSRRYSVTFGQLREARTEHRRAERHPGRRTRPLGPSPGRDRRPGPPASGPTPEPATPPPPTPNSPSPQPPAHASTDGQADNAA